MMVAVGGGIKGTGVGACGCPAEVTVAATSVWVCVGMTGAVSVGIWCCPMEATGDGCPAEDCVNVCET